MIMTSHQRLVRPFAPALLCAFAIGFAAPALAQISVSGISDKAMYADQATFTISQTAGWTYDARLDGATVPVGTAVVVRAVDYHELFVARTNNSTAAVETARIRFVVRSSARGDTENGVPPTTPPPLIPSAAPEFSGGQLQLIAPAVVPVGTPVPIIAWVLDDENHALRVNGMLVSPGLPGIAIKRGVGSGFLPSTNTPGQIDYVVSVGGIQTNRLITIEDTPVWQTVSGTLNGNVSWPANSRITVTNLLTVPAGSSVTIGAGTIVQLNSRVDIKLDGAMNINGTLENPVLFQAANAAQPWGGFLLEKNTSQLTASGTIFTGSGAEPGWFGSNGRPGSHRTEQALLYLTNAPNVTLTDCAAISLAGQLGHSVNGGNMTLTRFLMQRTTSGGEFTGAKFVVNDSALIDCPDDSTNFVDGDNDALYIIGGTHGFTNTLFGWTKDDGVDSGGSGGGVLDFQSCWFENTFHEANSLSGVGKIVRHHGDVFLNCSQALESGYDSPAGLLNGCLVIGMKTGARFGDNYSDRSYTGSMSATNSILIHNHRDVWGLNFQDWLWRTNAMNVRSNWLAAAVPQSPHNFVWDPESDGSRLAQFSTAPANAMVGVGLGVRTTQFSVGEITNGLPVRLSTFAPQPVSVDYAVEASGQVLESGTVTFQPGEMVRTIIPAVPVANGLLRIALMNPLNAEITGTGAVYFVPSGAVANTPLVSTGAVWRYLDTGENAGTSWRSNSFTATGWLSGAAELGYGEGDEATLIRSNGVSGRITTTYFRHEFNVASPEVFSGLVVRLKRDDGGIVYLNGGEVFRSNMTNGVVDYLTRAALASDDGKTWFSTNASAACLQTGTNVVAVEIHQESVSSSDVSFDLTLEALPRPVLQMHRFGDDHVIAWDGAGFVLEQTEELGLSAVWSAVSEASPTSVQFDVSQRFFRLRKK